MLQQTKKPVSTNRRSSKRATGPLSQSTPECAPAKPLEEVVFYGASRFEQPEIGLVFRRENETYRLVCISKSDRNYLRRFSQVWAFTALCERLPNQVH